LVKNKVDLSIQTIEKHALINDFIDKMLQHDINFGANAKKVATTSDACV